MATSCTLYLVRHAEKQQIPGEKDPPLAAQGESRAQALAARLAGEPIQALYATGYRRTQLTLAPLAGRVGLPIQQYDARDSAGFLKALLASPCTGARVVAGHSNTLPALLRAAGINEPAEEFDESRYGDLFIVDIADSPTQPARLRLERFGD